MVLTAGGARGAYQAGVLKRVGEIPSLRGKPSPFQIFAGASAGAINGAGLAAGAEDFYSSTQFIARLWENIKTNDVYRTDLLSMGGLVAIWMKDLSFGGIFGGGRAQSLLDFSPLRKYLDDNLKLDRIDARIKEGHLYALAITATNYYSGKSYTFIQGKENHPVWEKSRRLALATQLCVDHIWASAAIPMVFQPILLKTELGDFYFGDGGLRLVTPLSPAIRLGANKVFAIGIRGQKLAEDRARDDLISFQKNRAIMRRPPPAQVIGVVLNSIFLDHLDTDVEHMIRINEIVQQINTNKIAIQMKEPLRTVTPFIITPSEDLAKIAFEHSDRMPKVIRYFMEGLGTSKTESADLMSYLLFEPPYTRALIDLGYRDAAAKVDEIEHFLRAPTPT